MEFVIISYFDIENESFQRNQPLCDCLVPWRASQIPSTYPSRHKKYCAVLMTKNSFRKSGKYFRFDEVATTPFSQ